MNGEKINIPSRPLRILVAPLDWGLGHTTRCIPIIKLLLQSGVTVVLAAEGAGSILLKQEFPHLQILPLDGYRVRYSQSKKTFAISIFFQLPKITAAINREHKWLQKTAKAHNIDAVISDNRLGLYLKDFPCIYITHQLNIITGYSWLNRLVQKVHYKFINYYNACWVPDVAHSKNLAGNLSHPVVLPTIPVSYCGVLSRFSDSNPEPIISSLLVILSGPEPQRSLFESLLIPQLKNFDGSVVLVRGLPGSDSTIQINSDTIVFNHLPAATLEQYVHGATMIIARSGYSTVMDITAAKRNAILVPTPGQTEQEYLATYLKQQGRFYSENQQDFLLGESLEKAKHFYESNTPAEQYNFNTQPIMDWLSNLKPVDHGL